VGKLYGELPFDVWAYRRGSRRRCDEIKSLRVGVDIVMRDDPHGLICVADIAESPHVVGARDICQAARRKGYGDGCNFGRPR